MWQNRSDDKHNKGKQYLLADTNVYVKIILGNCLYQETEGERSSILDLG